MLALPGASEGLRHTLAEGLAAVNDLLLRRIDHDDPFIAQASGHLAAAGGKRFRPLLTILASELGEGVNDRVVAAATGVELTHLASLYHDDVMDEAPLRRGAPSANARWDNTIAILTGDFLFARSSRILADLGPEAVRIQAHTFERLCTGQIRETVGPRAAQDPIEHHLAVLADKTGSLIAAAGRYGSLMSGAAPEVVDTLTDFGERIGVAFQLADDLVDITSESAQSGKTPGTDLREGIPTLAALIALSGTDPADARLRDLLGRPLPDDAEHAEALSLLRGHAAVQEAQQHARRWAGSARDCLADLPSGPARDVLEDLCDYVVSRSA